MLAFEYEPLVFSLEPKTLDEKKDKGDTSGAGPSNTRTIEEELGDLRGGKESPNRVAAIKTYALEQILERNESIV